MQVLLEILTGLASYDPKRGQEFSDLVRERPSKLSWRFIFCIRLHTLK